MLKDARTAARRLARSPGFTAVTVTILALGIGANTALWSALHAALTRASPYPDADRLVMVDLLLARNADAPLDTLSWSYPKFELARERVASVEPMAGFTLRFHTLTGAGDAARTAVEIVSPAYFDLLGARPALGRAFGPGEEPPAEGRVALLGHALWETRFGSDPGVLGRTVTLEGAAFEVVGVLPPGFRGATGRAELWIPMAGVPALGNARRLEAAWAHWFRVIGRLGPGVSLERARAELAALGDALTEAYPDPSGGGAHGATAVPFLAARVNPVARLAVGVASAGGLLLLLVAGANVAGLLLARASARRGDVAVRAALGAGRWRLVREHMLESLLLAGAGGALGLALALGVQDLVAGVVRGALDTSGSRSLQFLDPDALGVDGRALGVGLGMALALGLLAGLLPLRAAARPDLTGDLRAGGRALVPGKGEVGEAARAFLVTGQLALTLVLLAGAGLMGASFLRLGAVDPGFSHDRVLTLRWDRGPAPADETRLFEEALVERAAAVGGVTHVATAPCPPLAGTCEVVGVRRVDDGPVIDYGDMEGILAYPVSDGYFETLGVALLKGRTFTAEDVPGGPPVAVVSETAARSLFPGGSALGHRIAVTHELTEEAQAEVVGVVADVRHDGLETEPMQALYFSRRQAPAPYGTLFVRTTGDPYQVADAVRREVAALDPALPLFEVGTLAERRAAATARTRVVLGLLAAFALLGLLLSAVGIWGIVSYSVVRRTREMGLRLALGASAREVLGLVVKRPALLAVAGAALGVAGSLALTRRAEALLFGVEPADPAVLAVATATLVLVTLAAAWLPARRAARLDPAETLRGE